MGTRSLRILYGSQTGTAQEVAERIWRDSRRFHFTGCVQPMDEFDVTHLIYEKLVIFVCATTGDGKEPDNMKQFWKFLLRKNLPLHSLNGLRFAVMGLGDSSYEKFNFVAKKLYRRLSQLGGQPVLEIGLADDQHDLRADAIVDPWVEDLWNKLLNLFPLPSGVCLQDKDSLCPARWNVILEEKTALYNNANVREKTKSFKAKVVENYCLHNNPSIVILQRNERTTAVHHFQDVRHIEFYAPDITYKPGDVLMIQAQNSPSCVKQFFQTVSNNPKIKLDPNCIIRVTQNNPDAPVPSALKQPLALEACVEQYWDLSAIPHRYFFHLLSCFTSSDIEKEKLKEFVSSEGQEDFYNYCYRPKRTVLEVLQDFPIAAQSIPLPYMFEMFRPIRPRAFSIASSPLGHKGYIHILVAVVNYKTRLVSPRLGLCSNWLAHLPEGSFLPVWTQKGTFQFPLKLNPPMVMVGPGTGVSPFRSLIHEQVALGNARADLLHLFFGCRSKQGDFHYSTEWLSLQENGNITLFCAFSRDQENKIYVQHVMKEQASLLWSLLHTQKGYLYLAGRSDGLPTAVKDILINDVAAVCGNLSDTEAQMWFDELQTSGRYQTETWS